LPKEREMKKKKCEVQRKEMKTKKGSGSRVMEMKKRKG
jgi:hypothetical protein